MDKSLLSIVLKARHLGESAFLQWLKVPEQELGGISPGFGIVVEDIYINLH